MKQIVDKLNKIAKKINENVELSDRDLIIDSLDSITKAYGGTPNDSTLIVDKLDDIYNNISPAVSGNIEITENTAEGEPLDISQYATATVNVAGGGGIPLCTLTFINNRQNAVPMSDVIYAYPIIDNVMDIADNETISTGTSIYQCLYNVLEDFGACIGTLGNPTVTDLVNCKIADSGGYPVLTPINTSLNSSATITIGSGGGGGGGES